MIRKESITHLILEKIFELGEVYLDIFFPPQYSYTRISRRLFGLDGYPKVNPRTLSATLSRLCRKGLVKRREKGRTSYWSLTRKGIDGLKADSREIPKKDGIPRLVIFDIPERERAKRNTLRCELIACNFIKLQKSVWIGYNPLPQDFIELLGELNLSKKVHIFSIKDKGTLEDDYY